MGCASSSLENTAQQPSPYAGDATLFRADQAVTTGYNLLHEFVIWEKKFRPAINNKDVKHAADNVRAHAKEWIQSAQRLRDAYKKDPNEANKTALNTSLDIISQALQEANTYMTQNIAKKG